MLTLPSGQKVALGKEPGKEARAEEEKAASLAKVVKEIRAAAKDTAKNAPAALQMGNRFVMDITTSIQGAVIHAVISSMSVEPVSGNTRYTPASQGIVQRRKEERTSMCLCSDYPMLLRLSLYQFKKTL